MLKMNDIDILASKAKKQYLNHGLKSLLISGVERFLTGLIQRRALTRKEVRQIAESYDLIWYLNQEDKITITPPNSDELSENFGECPLEYIPDQPYICEIPDCTIYRSGAVGMFGNGRLITDTISGNFPISIDFEPSHYGFYIRGVGLRNKPSKIMDDGPYLPLVSGHQSYYHWVVEYLPKLRLLKHY